MKVPICLMCFLLASVAALVPQRTYGPWVAPSTGRTGISSPWLNGRGSWISISCLKSTNSGDLTGTKSILHPVTIKAVARALKLRAENDPQQPLRVQGDVEALDVALTAGKIASEAVEDFRNRLDDGSSSPDIEHTIAGRIVGVAMRFDDLEKDLVDRIKVDDGSSFGLIDGEDGRTKEEVDRALSHDDDLLLARAKALLALFLLTVEAPGMKASGASVSDGSVVDFLDKGVMDKLFPRGNANGDAPLEEDSEDSTARDSKTQSIGDKLREATGIRPSLHPVTINAIADALKLRAQNKKFSPLRKTKDVEDLDIMITAGEIAKKSVEKRQKASSSDGMTLNAAEEKTIAGRIVAVLMRLEELETELHTRCSDVSWVLKYGEWDMFGILPDEEDAAMVDEKVLSDPLFAMNRAECLLALFLHEVERPCAEKSGENLPGGGHVDFLDGDRMEVVLGGFTP